MYNIEYVNGGMDMKKPYSKPTVAFQNMFLASGVSMGCSYSSNHAFDSCVTEIPGWGGETIFNDTTGECTYGVEMGAALCYDIPQESSNIFES